MLGSFWSTFSRSLCSLPHMVSGSSPFPSQRYSSQLLTNEEQQGGRSPPWWTSSALVSIPTIRVRALLSVSGCFVRFWQVLNKYLLFGLVGKGWGWNVKGCCYCFHSEGAVRGTQPFHTVCSLSNTEREVCLTEILKSSQVDSED